MATILKDRARKPVIDNGLAFPRKSFIDGKMMYGFTVSERWTGEGTKQQSFDVLLTEKEFLRIVSENLKDLALARPTEPDAAG